MRVLPALLLLAAPALAQSSLYDAGANGSPPVAPSPESLGWARTSSGLVTEADVSPDPDWPVNAWQINDPGAGASVWYAVDWWEFNGDWTFTMNYRPLAGSVWVLLDNGDSIGAHTVWKLELELAGNDVLAYSGFDQGTVHVLPGAGDGAYHEIEVRGDNWSADLYFDGTHVGFVEQFGWGPAEWGGGVGFGTIDDEAGRARFQHVELTTATWGPVGTSFCGPAVPHSGGQSATIKVEGFLVPQVSSPMRLRAHDLPVNEFGYFLVADDTGLVQPPGSAGNLCLSGNLGRFSSQLQHSGGAGAFWIDIHNGYLPTNPPSSVQPGETWHFQAWFRDGVTSNFTEGRAVSF